MPVFSAITVERFATEDGPFLVVAFCHVVPILDGETAFVKVSYVIEYRQLLYHKCRRVYQNKQMITFSFCKSRKIVKDLERFACCFTRIKSSKEN